MNEISESEYISRIANIRAEYHKSQARHKQLFSLVVVLNITMLCIAFYWAFFT